MKVPQVRHERVSTQVERFPVTIYMTGLYSGSALCFIITSYAQLLYVFERKNDTGACLGKQISCELDLEDSRNWSCYELPPYHVERLAG